MKPIKLKNKGQFKATEFKIKLDQNKAEEVIDDVIKNAKNNYFSNQMFKKITE